MSRNAEFCQSDLGLSLVFTESYNLSVAETVPGTDPLNIKSKKRLKFVSEL